MVNSKNISMLCMLAVHLFVRLLVLRLLLSTSPGNTCCMLSLHLGDGRVFCLALT
jgi:hypothetical protein